MSRPRISVTTQAVTTVAGATQRFPSDAGLTMDGFEDLSVQFQLNTTGGGADDTESFTFEASDDGTTWIDITKAGYDVTNDVTGNASYPCGAGATLSAKVDFDQLNAKYFRIVNTSVQGGGGWDATYAYTIRRKAASVVS